MMLDPDEAWMARAACRDHPQLGWIKDATDAGLGETATMAVICAGCPVRGQCAGFADRKAVSSGFWAGRHRDVDASGRLGGAA